MSVGSLSIHHQWNGSAIFRSEVPRRGYLLAHGWCDLFQDFHSRWVEELHMGVGPTIQEECGGPPLTSVGGGLADHNLLQDQYAL